MSSTSTSGGARTVLTVDANVLQACLLRGAALRLLTSPRFVFLTTVHTTWEVARYLPRLVERLASRGVSLSEKQLEAEFHSLPIFALPDSFYRSHVPRARDLIAHRDPGDVDILALTLRLRVPLWTNDRDFEGLTEIRIVTTAELLTMR